MSLCEYQNILGIPGEGIHQIRLLNLAVVDVIGTFLLAELISSYSGISYCKVLIAVFILALFLHWLFCVPTTVTKLLKLV